MTDPLPAILTCALTCKEVEALLPLVADGALDAAADPDLFGHLAACPRCQDSLAEHDLISHALTLPAPVTLPGPGLRLTLRPPQRPAHHRWALAAAATLIVGLGLLAQGHLGSGSTAPAPAALAIAHPHPAAVPPASQTLAIEVEVVTVPGSTAHHPRYLVRRGEQVMLVDPAIAPAVEAPGDAQPASFRY